MPSETPLLRVSRPVAACLRCRSAKIKCDGKLPSCTACEKANKAAECSATNDQFARGKERSYVATLENRIDKLNQKLAEAKMRRRSSVAMTDLPQSDTPKASTDGALRPRERRAAQRRELANIDELVADFGLMAVNATARDFYGFTSTMSYAKLILAASTKEALPTGMKKDLPARHVASSLMQEYLDHIHILIPILDVTSFYTSIDAVYSPDQSKASPYDHWLVRLVLAISSAGQSQQRGDTLYSDAIGHICAAIEHAEDVLHPGSIWSIQAVLLLVLFAMVDPHHFDSWTLIGVAARAMVDLGLHQEPSKTANVPKAKLELRRRVYYCVFTLDRSTSMVQTRSYAFSDDSAHVAFPFASKILSPPTSPAQNKLFWTHSHDSALALFKLRRIQSTWYTQLFQSGRTPWRDPYSYIWKAYHEMTNWYSALSSSLSPTVKEYLELELLYSYVYLLSPNARCPEPSEHAERFIFEHCVHYSSQMLHVTTDAATKRTPFTFYDAMRVYTTGRTFIDILTKNGNRVLQPTTITPGSELGTTPTGNELDPLSAPGTHQPAIPSRHSSIVSTVTSRGSVDLGSPTHRAIGAINDFLSVLSYFGRRFGYVGGISWRDKFQRESQALIAQLQQRLMHQTQMEQGFALWNAGNTDPSPGQQIPANLSRHNSGSTPIPPINAAFYPSPPYSQPSPDYLTRQAIAFNQPLTNAFSAQTFPMSNPGVSIPQMSMDPSNAAGVDLFQSQQMSMSQGTHLAPMSAGDLGLSQFTAWETLPGGSLNARFS